MRTSIQVSGAVFGVVAGGILGGLIGWALGDFGGRSDPENVWFISMIVGAAVGLATAIASILRRSRGLVSALLLGTVSGGVVAATVILLVAWQRRPRPRRLHSRAGG
jgi:hypothetical protein